MFGVLRWCISFRRLLTNFDATARRVAGCLAEVPTAEG